jgi:hypothetical protein
MTRHTDVELAPVFHDRRLRTAPVHRHTMAIVREQPRPVGPEGRDGSLW